jgi:hypothetical protein
MLIGLCMCIDIFSLRYVEPLSVYYGVRIEMFANGDTACGTEKEGRLW